MCGIKKEHQKCTKNVLKRDWTTCSKRSIIKQLWAKANIQGSCGRPLVSSDMSSLMLTIVTSPYVNPTQVLHTKAMEEKSLPRVGGGLHGYMGWVWGGIPMLGQRVYIIVIYVGMAPIV